MTTIKIIYKLEGEQVDTKRIFTFYFYKLYSLICDRKSCSRETVLLCGENNMYWPFKAQFKITYRPLITKNHTRFPAWPMTLLTTGLLYTALLTSLLRLRRVCAWHRSVCGWLLSCSDTPTRRPSPVRTWPPATGPERIYDYKTQARSHHSPS